MSVLVMRTASAIKGLLPLFVSVICAVPFFSSALNSGCHPFARHCVVIFSVTTVPFWTS